MQDNKAKIYPEKGLLRGLGQRLQAMRLGDMLVACGLITEDELHQALSLQKQSQKPLGETLVALGAITPVQLYRTLAEQWCLKISAAGLTVMLNTLTPISNARAEDRETQHVQLAAAFAPAASKIERGTMTLPRLFGFAEIKSNDISEFSKWTTAIDRFEDQMSVARPNPRLQDWKNALQEMKSKPVKTQIEAVNDYMNNITYIEDRDNYGRTDFWATPIEFLSNGGDCEDYAIAKYASLRALGFTTDQLRIAVVHDKVKNVAHAVLVVYAEGEAFILDNQDKRLRDSSDVTRYKPIFSINSNSWWLHKSMMGV